MRQLSRLLKGECICMDASGFVYNTPACIRPKPQDGPESEADPNSEQGELASAVKKARTIVDGANRYLLKMHGQMREQAREMYESAREEGCLKGYEEGQAQAFAQNEQTLAQITALLQEIDRGKDALLMQYEQSMLDLALDIARKVVGTQLMENDEAFLNIFRRAAEGLRATKAVRLQVSRHEARIVTASSDYLKSLVSGAERLDIEVLEDKEPGTCILETEDVLIDASADRQLEKLTQAVEAIRQ